MGDCYSGSTTFTLMVLWISIRCYEGYGCRLKAKDFVGERRLWMLTHVKRLCGCFENEILGYYA